MNLRNNWVNQNSYEKMENLRTARFDTQSCRIFIFFNTSIKKPRAEYYELRNAKGEIG